MAKKVVKVFRLELQAGSATPAPPVGPVLGQHMLNIMQFVKEYNAKTANLSGVAPAEVTVYTDNSFSFVIKSSPAAHLIRQAAGIEKGASKAGGETVGSIKQQDLKRIAQEKLEDLNALSLEGAMKIIAGTAQSMGISIEKE